MFFSLSGTDDRKGSNPVLASWTTALTGGVAPPVSIQQPKPR